MTELNSSMSFEIDFGLSSPTGYISLMMFVLIIVCRFCPTNIVIVLEHAFVGWSAFWRNSWKFISHGSRDANRVRDQMLMHLGQALRFLGWQLLSFKLINLLCQGVNSGFLFYFLVFWYCIC